MQVPVIVQAESEDHYSAELLGRSELRAEAPTEAEALRKLTASLRDWLESAKLIQVDVPLQPDGSSNPWLDGFGRSADDPDFEAYQTEVERHRGADERG